MSVELLALYTRKNSSGLFLLRPTSIKALKKSVWGAFKKKKTEFDLFFAKVSSLVLLIFKASDDVCNVSDDFDWIGSGLSAPKDPIECVTDFLDGFKSTNELSFLEDFGDFLGKSEEEIETTPSRDFKFGITKKKPRSKRRLKQRAWPTKDCVFSALENHEFLKRVCTHCQIDKTPQWRIGPLGPKTLCNACGVRYNTGRLFPEYRPAASPSFDQKKHSNLHKLILRRRANLI
ncbi:PREDICTED: GATA transcription factor 7-like [Populus euphratica]|uniref:GATA transcription factor 7-like n=1 Tax=Populus euphratica TaxID=75702 RepID=A0AAJ6UL20_POPEU|nr:PREDICTED: GATA transcription factor 7-like [Populus euphratica]